MLAVLLVMVTFAALRPPDAVLGIPVSVTSDRALPLPETDASAALAAAAALEPSAETDASKEAAAADAEAAAADTEACAADASEASADGGDPENEPVTGENDDAPAAGVDPLLHADRPTAPAAMRTTAITTWHRRPLPAPAAGECALSTGPP
ncbi:hypothetical protein GCM10010193_41120 [Kitasatospora atroaurantiaca]